MENGSNKGLIISIIGSTILLTASIFYFGMEIIKRPVLDDETLKTKISEGIKAYVADAMKEQNEAENNVPSEPVDMAGLVNKDDPVLGDKDAKVTIVEFSDFECPYCGVYAKNVFPDLKKEYIDTGKVKYVFKHFPLSFHQSAYPAASATECVRALGGDEYFYKMHDYLFENQENLTTETFEKFVEDSGIKYVLFTECFGTDQYKDAIYADQEAGGKIGVSGTPAFVINGTLLVGAQPIENFKMVIDQELNK